MSKDLMDKFIEHQFRNYGITDESIDGCFRCAKLVVEAAILKEICFQLDKSAKKEAIKRTFELIKEGTIVYKAFDADSWYLQQMIKHELEYNQDFVNMVMSGKPRKIN